MDTMKYLETAVSKDPSRYNLCSIFRDADKMVATDGYRLHMVSGLPKIDKPHLLNGTDGQFPDYTQVIPESTQRLVDVKLDKKQLKALKDYVAFTGKGTVSRLTVNKSGILLSATVGNITASILLEVEDFHNGLQVTGLKAAQLFDALIPDCLMSIQTGTKGHAPLVLESYSYNTKAIIMPCRLD